MTERANAGLHAHAFEWLRKQLPLPLPAVQVLDLGCGTGAWLARWQAAGCLHLQGADRDTAQFNLPGVPVAQLDLDARETPDFGRFDLVTAVEIIEHLANPGQLVSLAAKHLSEGGYLFISTPNIESLPARVKHLFTGRLPHFDQKSDPTHIYPVYHSNLVKMAEQNGFVLEAQGSYPEKGFHNFSFGTKLLAGIISPFAKPGPQGDNSLWLFRKLQGR